MYIKNFRSVLRRITKEIIQRRNCSQVIINEKGKGGEVILNRPKVLNAMGTQMIVELIDILQKFEKDKQFAIIKGAGDKAFTSGGDIITFAKIVTENGNEENLSELPLKLNEFLYLIYTLEIPVVTITNGITFGGGAGIAAFSKYAVATERTLFSMPEVKFGFHPNAGASYFFNRYDRPLAYYLALTAGALRGSDIVKANYATHFCRSANLNQLEEELVKCSGSDDVERALDKVCERNVPEISLEPIIDKIKECFSEDTVEGIMLKLEKDGSTWAKETLNFMRTLSPTSLKVTLRQLQKAKELDILECFAMESNLSVNFYKYTDVLEGTKTVLTDKTYVPKWQPAKLSDVTKELVERYFESINDKRQLEILRKRQPRLANNQRLQ